MSVPLRIDVGIGYRFRSLPCPQHGSVQPYPSAGAAMIIPERYSCTAIARAAAPIRGGGPASQIRPKRHTPAGLHQANRGPAEGTLRRDQAWPRTAANQLCELGTHMSTVATRLARKPSPLPPRPSANPRLMMDSSNETPATTVRAKAGPLTAFLHLHRQDNLRPRTGPGPPARAAARGSRGPVRTRRAPAPRRSPITPASRPTSPPITQIQ